MLHFELCYYRLIERAIERRCTLFEAGAQGEHKLKRGLAPGVHAQRALDPPPAAGRARSTTSSDREAVAVAEQVAEYAAHTRFATPATRRTNGDDAR